ncbi:MAG: hypothetical protein EBT04_10880 [Betaproteobacteria bacterium]|nr:hypothetical protein [Betaproteobacteria bacterium]
MSPATFLADKLFTFLTPEICPIGSVMSRPHVRWALAKIFYESFYNSPLRVRDHFSPKRQIFDSA